MEDAPESLTADDLNSINVFSDQIARIMEHFCEIWGAELSHQSDRSLPRTHFPQGMTANTKTNGHEEAGTIILFLLALTSSFGEHLFEDRKTGAAVRTGNKGMLGGTRVADWVWSLETMLMLESFQHHEDGATEGELKQFETHLKPMMERLFRTMDRKNGMGNNTLKNHSWVHAIPDH